MVRISFLFQAIVCPKKKTFFTNLDCEFLESDTHFWKERRKLKLKTFVEGFDHAKKGIAVDVRFSCGCDQHSS